MGRLAEIVMKPLRILTAAFAICACLPSAAGAAEVEWVKFRAKSEWRGQPVDLAGTFYPTAQGRKAPAVILMHGCGGLRTSVRSSLYEHANLFVRNGFAALLLDSFGPRGIDGGWVCEGLGRLAEARSYRLQDAQDAADWLKARAGIDGQNIFLMGQSNGGSVALRAAAAGGFRAVAAYYPWCGAASGNRAPLIVFGAGRDDWVPPGACGLRPQSENYRFVLYPEAAHSFDVRSGITSYLGHRIGFDASATADSRSRMIAFFRQHMR